MPSAALNTNLHDAVAGYSFTDMLLLLLLLQTPFHVFVLLDTGGNAVADWDGDSLEISKISRLDMGAYLCIASNGVGGVAVSKRIKVSVDCK